MSTKVKNENESKNDDQKVDNNTNQQTEDKDSKQSQKATDSKDGSNEGDNGADKDGDDPEGILGKDLTDGENGEGSSNGETGEGSSDGGDGSGNGEGEGGEGENAEEEYEIEFSDESPLSEQDQDALIEMINDYGLTEEQAKGLVDKFEGLYKNGAGSVEAQLREKIRKDREEILNSEYYATPERKAETIQALKEVSQVFAGIDFSDKDSVANSDWLKFLNSSAGNSIALTKFMMNIHSRIKGDDAFIHHKGKAGGEKKEISVEQQWYPEYFKNNS